MRKGSAWFFIVSCLCFVMVASLFGCDGGGEKPSKTSTSTGTSTASTGLPSTPHVFVYHKNGFTPSQKADCISCHGVGSGSDFPTAPSWNGTKFSQWYKGTHVIEPGSPQDHTNRTSMNADGCMATGCHAF